MRYVIRKGSLSDNLFLTASHRWGRLEKAETFTQRQAERVAEALATYNYGIFDLAHARDMVRERTRSTMVQETRDEPIHPDRQVRRVQ